VLSYLLHSYSQMNFKQSSKSQQPSKLQQPYTHSQQPAKSQQQSPQQSPQQYLKQSLQQSQPKPKTYIIDWLNIFSDFREIKYAKQHIDFHQIKHQNIESDTFGFFELFFTKYIQYVGIEPSGNFIFVMKKLYNYDRNNMLDKVMQRFSNFKVSFMIIDEQYSNTLIDKNKDDFLCQYLMYTMKSRSDCILISNDRYRDAISYIKLFDFILNITIIRYANSKRSEQKFQINPQEVSDGLISQSNYMKRRSIPKRNLNSII